MITDSCYNTVGRERWYKGRFGSYESVGSGLGDGEKSHIETLRMKLEANSVVEGGLGDER